MELKQIIKVIENMDPAEADAMGVSCQYFAAKLIEEFYEEFKRERKVPDLPSLDVQMGHLEDRVPEDNVVKLDRRFNKKLEG